MKALRLKPVTTVTADSRCAAAIETMRDKGFDQLPVLAPTGRRLVGLVTLGNLLSRISHGRATGASQVKEVMFDFSKIQEVVTDPRDIGVVEVGGGKQADVNQHGEADEQDEESQHQKGQNKRRFIEITMDTPLSALNRFFEWQSAAVVTERDLSDSGAGGKGAMRPVAVVTKVDLLTWLLAQKKI